MEQKTMIHSEEGKQELLITRVFDLPVDLLFQAHGDPEIVGQWMGTNVLKLDSRKHGSFQFETTDPRGTTHRFNGVIHELIPSKKIIRTFEMENTDFDAWIEYIDFEQINDETSKLTMKAVYKSVEQRDQILKMPFAQGLNWAHNRLEQVSQSLKLNRTKG